MSTPEETKEYPKLTPEEEKYINGSYAWRYGLPGLVLVAVLLLPYDTPLVAGIGMIPYCVVTWLLARKPSLAFVFAMQKSKKIPLHVPESEAEAKEYRATGKLLSIVLLVLTAAFFILWLIRKGQAAA